MRSKILSKLIFASCVRYSDREYYGLCVLSKDIDRRLPLQLQCSYRGQQGDVSQSVREKLYNPFLRGIISHTRSNSAQICLYVNGRRKSPRWNFIFRPMMINNFDTRDITSNLHSTAKTLTTLIKAQKPDVDGYTTRIWLMNLLLHSFYATYHITRPPRCTLTPQRMLLLQWLDR